MALAGSMPMARWTASFNPGAGGSYPYVLCLAVQADGKILVGGGFTTLGGQPCNYLGRLNNTEPATQNLSFDGSTITWLRGGASPEVWRTTFDFSTDGTNWASLGAGTRIAGLPAGQAGGWQLTSVSLPSPNGTIRARGYVTGGEYNGSSWFVETDLVVGAPPVILVNDPSFGFTSNRFGFEFSGTAGQVVIVETSTNLASWTPVATNTLAPRPSISANPTQATSPSDSIACRAPPLRPLCPTNLKSAIRNLQSSIVHAGSWRKAMLHLHSATQPERLTHKTNLHSPFSILAVLLAALVALSTLHFQPACAQTADDFNPGANDYVFSLAVQADGKVLVGGGFTTLGGQSRNGIGRLNADGTVDTSFNPGAGGSYPYVLCLALQADGKILVGGEFTTLGGQSRTNVGRLNADGTLDSAFNPGANKSVSSLALQPDGKILVGGDFTTLGGQTRNYLGRLNADGTVDSAFDPGASNEVSSLALQADGKILVGGGFTTLGGQTRNYIGRLNADGTARCVACDEPTEESGPECAGAPRSVQPIPEIHTAPAIALHWQSASA